MRFNKKQWSWIFYDWANSGYGIIVTTAVLPVYFKSVAQSSGVSAANATAFWGYANSFGTLLVSILAPVLGALADYPHHKKRLMNYFSFLGIIMTFGLALVPSSQWQLLLGVYILSIIGYSAGNLFYDSFLTDVASNEEMDTLSSNGYAYGYLGGVVAFILFLVLQLTSGFGMLSSYGVARWSFLLAAIWWIIFFIPLLKNVQQVYSLPENPHPVTSSFKRVWKTITHLRKYKAAAWFLVAYFFYIDGVDTIFTMATSIGMDMGINTTTLMLVLLVVQLVAFPFSILYGWFANKVSTRAGILLGIVLYLGICLYALKLTTAKDFWILAVLVGTSQGGIQALSRSYFGKLIPKKSGSEFFGFYNILGKFSAVMGPVLVGIVTQITGKSTIGAASLSILFFIGLIIFLMLPRLVNEN
ncbi:MFS transporter [Companilactobacillus bobalius]|uniref:Putative MFS-type transporter YxiO n=2 Tax=Companilactobacillus bobalius TaxID=2801451 RepID=A0A202FDC6_9LACO|nr:MFS transporter [Companilactobacillus bobalius]KAE9561804.1 MFS transporter [Companilactobacillus bobalius]KRK82725.1 putative nucleotide pyrophosphatase (putative) [Companilactobacillus bobalius DSM 19674]OVE98432.1 putative MFS-type transporter YxiO [Companilactobacillus bobalius]GEO57526.1 MFS transporter [Companilactobacillus paralimentarius]